MALQVWCPLIKDIHNQGISNIMPSASEATFTTSGKIGSGALNSSNEFSVTISALSGKKVWSFCFWGYVVSSTITSNWTQIARINDCSSNFRVEVCPKTISNGIYCYSTHNNSGNAISNGSISSPNGGYYDQWAHFCLTSDGTTIFKYMNGELIGTCSYNGTGAITGTFVLTNNHKIYKNDLRIYDHCLSPKEVKEISKGLVLHYPLNDAYVEETSNIASNLSPSQIGGWQKMTITKLSTNNYHLKHQTSDSTNLSYWSTFVYTLPSEYSNKTISFSARIKNIVYNDIKDSSWLYIGPGNNGQYPTHGSATFYCYELKENQLISWTGVLSNSNRYVLVELWNDANSTSGSIEFDLVDIQIEEKDHVTPYTPNTRNETTVYDCSGYQNNGTVSGNVTLSVDSPRYIGSYKFIPNAMISTSGIVNFDKCTYSVWCKDPNMSYKIVFCDGTSKVAFGESGGFLCSCGSNSQNKFTKNNWKNSDWNHVVVVRDGSTYKMYINGEAETQSGAADHWSHSASTITVGGREENAAMWNGNISDFRIYSTALSADDIKELYNTSAYILDNGTLLTYNLEE